MPKRKNKQRIDRVLELEREGRDLIPKIVGLPREKCLEIYGILQNFQWPDELGDKPSGWEQMSAFDFSCLVNALTEYLEEMIPLKERKRHERALKFGETEEQFNEWWESYLIESLHIIAGRLV